MIWLGKIVWGRREGVFITEGAFIGVNTVMPDFPILVNRGDHKMPNFPVITHSWLSYMPNFSSFYCLESQIDVIKQNESELAAIDF